MTTDNFVKFSVDLDAVRGSDLSNLKESHKAATVKKLCEALSDALFEAEDD